MLVATRRPDLPPQATPERALPGAPVGAVTTSESICETSKGIRDEQT